MKMFVFVFALLGALMASANHNDPAYWRMVRKGVEAKIALHVVDEGCVPLQNADVRVVFSRFADEYRICAKFHCEIGVSNVWDLPAVRGTERIRNGTACLHMNQKPIELLERIIRSSSDEGGFVFPGRPVEPSDKWAHKKLWKGVIDALRALPAHFHSDTFIEGVNATDVFTLNSALGATIENQVVETLNTIRSVWDPVNDRWARSRASESTRSTENGAPSKAWLNL